MTEQEKAWVMGITKDLSLKSVAFGFGAVVAVGSGQVVVGLAAFWVYDSLLSVATNDSVTAPPVPIRGGKLLGTVEWINPKEAN